MKRVAATMAVLLALVLGMGLQSAGAAIPQVIAYQGLLTDSTGNPLNGTYRLDVKIYTGATGGSPLWAETHANVTVTKGVFSVMLGSVNPFSTVPTLTFDSQYYLGVTIDNGTELTPRVQLASVGSAFNADKVDGLDASSFALASAIPSHGKQMFTTSGTFTVPAGVTSVYITGVGGGGGGGPYSGLWGAASGGGGASLIARKVTVTPGGFITVTVGAGGAGSQVYYISGSSGGASSFGTLVTIPGGGGGLINCVAGLGGSAPAGGVSGQNGVVNGVGGGTAFGTGINNAAGSAGYGGGGMGPTSSTDLYGNTVTLAATSGRPGFILVEW